MGNPERNICTAVLAHVDAGKTTLSEALLYQSGNIRKAGRVDNGDAFLDNYTLERARGITIFSKQAVLKLPDAVITLLDTPGHVDFSAEMERVLSVLDYAILVINGADGVQSHTKTLWKLLARYRIPVFLFVNKMDQAGTDKEKLLAGIRENLHENCVDFSDKTAEDFLENVSMCSEETLESYLETGCVDDEEIRSLIQRRKLFPSYFGSALKMEGVLEFLEDFLYYTKDADYPTEFGARVFKIARDAQGMRLTYLKVTGGTLRVKQTLTGSKKPGCAGGLLTEGVAEEDDLWEEKVNQIRIYSGERFETVDEVRAGGVCAVTGLSGTFPGEGLGIEQAAELPMLAPVLTYQLLLPEGCSPAVFLPKLRELEEEEPELHIVWDERLKEIQLQMMGAVQIEVLKSLIKERFSVDVEFGPGNIVYKETIANTVEGVGHFEPLRHYAEVHLKLEPSEPGSGMVFAADCSTDVLDKNWQRLVLTHLEEKEHIGVLTGSAITDIRITLVSGRAHLKHTEGGDFRQATYRAVRQGLMQAEPVLLEPYYDFVLEIPEDTVGRAMTDIDRMHGTLDYSADAYGNDTGAGMRQLTGSAPVASMQNYQQEVITYTKGLGRLSCTLSGYRPCHNEAEVIARIGYDPEADTENPASSVFCAHGAGFLVPWEMVFSYMHLPTGLSGKLAGMADELASGEKTDGDGADWTPEKSLPEAQNGRRNRKDNSVEEIWLGTEEIDRILAQTYNANKRGRDGSGRNNWKLRGRERSAASASAVTRNYQPKVPGKEYLLVDGYNIIFAWEELAALAEVNIDGARGKLLDILCNYQGIRGCELIVVFDAYRVVGHQTEVSDYHNIHVVYTKEAETADQYIEKFAHENAKKYRVTVATSDGLEQIIIRGAGCELLSARDFAQEVAEKSRQVQEDYRSKNAKSGRNYLLDGVPQEVLGEIPEEN